MKLEKRRSADIHIGYVNYLECISTFELVIVFIVIILLYYYYAQNIGL